MMLFQNKTMMFQNKTISKSNSLYYILMAPGGGGDEVFILSRLKRLEKLNICRREIM